MSKQNEKWQPSCEIETLKQRAQFIAQVRHFFYERNVLEVETPLLSSGTVTDVHLDAFQTQFCHVTDDALMSATGEQTLYLQTSPEFAMKRLLAAGSGPIFQICKAFRNESAGRFHNPEFTMLEWYRPGFTDIDLMNEVDDLVSSLLNTPPAIRISYQAIFQQVLNIDPLSASLVDLKSIALQHYDDDWIHSETDKDTLLQWLFSMLIEPTLGNVGTDDEPNWKPVLVFDFPATQAALAKTCQHDTRVAHRFELYFQGIELANGYYELQDAKEQRCRFENDNHRRQHLGLPTKPIDENFLAAMAAGLPDCAGVALGLDRLLMCKLDKHHIGGVLSFTQENS